MAVDLATVSANNSAAILLRQCDSNSGFAAGGRADDGDGFALVGIHVCNAMPLRV